MCKVQNLSSIPKRKKRAINKRQPIHKRVRWIIHNLFQCFRVACTRRPHHRAPLGVIETLGRDRRTPWSSTNKIGSNYRSAHCLLLCLFFFFLARICLQPSTQSRTTPLSRKVALKIALFFFLRKTSVSLCNYHDG